MYRILWNTKMTTSYLSYSKTPQDWTMIVEWLSKHLKFQKRPNITNVPGYTTVTCSKTKQKTLNAPELFGRRESWPNISRILKGSRIPMTMDNRILLWSAQFLTLKLLLKVKVSHHRNLYGHQGCSAQTLGL